MKILNLYAGLGGNRKLWGDEHEVVAVENNESIARVYQDLFPNDEVVVDDAHEYLLNNYAVFDFIWSSPPCPTHSKVRKAHVHAGQNKPVYPDMKLYEEIIFLKHYSNKHTKYVIENVTGYYDPLIKPQIQLDRHYIWSNFYIRNRVFEKELGIADTYGTETRFGFNLKDYKLDTRKDQILRNLVNPEIGKYILEQANKGKKPIFNFNY